MIVWVVDVFVFLLLCVGSKLAMPRVIRLLCRVGVLYLVGFAIFYYLWLKPQFQYYQSHPHYFHPGISGAFTFEGFWQLFGNMVLVQGIMPIAVIFMVFFGVRWLATSPNARSGTSR